MVGPTLRSGMGTSNRPWHFGPDWFTTFNDTKLFNTMYLKPSTELTGISESGYIKYFKTTLNTSILQKWEDVMEKE